MGLLGRQNGRGVFKDQVVAAVGEELFAQMLRRMQVFARRVFPLAFSLLMLLRGRVRKREREVGNGVGMWIVWIS